MKRFLMLFTLIVTCLGLFAVEANAKRLGGGSSVGKQRTMDQQQMQRQPTAAPAQAAPAAAAPQSNRSKWLGPLAGLAIGAGLAAMFASMGLGEGMGMLLMIVLGVAALAFVVAMLRKKKQQAPMQYAGAGAPYSQPESAYQPVSGGSAAPVAEPVAAAPASIPAGFPVDAFLRSAKTSFIRLQAANDRKDLNDIREYTTPEMYAEISMQMQERDDAPQKTDVQAVNAALIEVVEEGDVAIASVRLSGQLSENGGAAENFDEVWHVQKNLRDDKAVWLLAGIQQVA
ncbi:MAG: Tim44 domain-containing protein [Nitrosomonadales bacterium]|nr:Tim44 domain-containing protein [Nitrosomonadales bacterium]